MRQNGILTWFCNETAKIVTSHICMRKLEQIKSKKLLGSVKFPRHELGPGDIQSDLNNIYGPLFTSSNQSSGKQSKSCYITWSSIATDKALFSPEKC